MKTERLTLSINEKILLVSNLHTMLAAGIPILEAIDSLLEDAKGNQKKLLLTMREDLGQGQRIYRTFSRFPRVFDKVTVNIIKASEEAGTLDEALKEIKENIKKEVEFNNRVRGAMIYPLFIMAVFVGVLIVILVVVVPKITTVFQRLNVPLPLPTQIMIIMSNFLMAYPIPLILAVIALFAGLSYLYRENKRVFIALITSLPLISDLARQIDLTRFTRSLYLLLTAGIPITTALELTQDVVLKREIYQVITHAKEVVLAGRKLSQALRDKKKVVPTIMIKIVEAGEHSGSLDKSLVEISEFLDYEVSNKLRTVTALMEPLLLVIVGIMVGGMMLAIIAPIYGLIGQVGPH